MMLINHLKESIATLKQLDLSIYPTEQINELMKHFGKTVVIEYRLHPGKKILRARPEDEQWPYITRASHSYKPQQYNHAFQRASTPNTTMFYGSVIPDELDKGDLDNERYVVTMEASPWLRAKESCGSRRIAYSRWEVTSDIKMVAILQNKDFFEASSHTRKIIKNFNLFVDEHPEHRETSILVSDYLASEFGKEEIHADYHYLISALYTEYLIRNNFDGVLYPSVRVGGQGFNVALTPHAADTKIKLVAAGECTMYKRAFGNSIIDNDTQAILNDQNQPFEFTNVQPQYHTGLAGCLTELSVETVEQLCTKPAH